MAMLALIALLLAFVATVPANKGGVGEMPTLVNKSQVQPDSPTARAASPLITGSSVRGRVPSDRDIRNKALSRMNLFSKPSVPEASETKSISLKGVSLKVENKANAAASDVKGMNNLQWKKANEIGQKQRSEDTEILKNIKIVPTFDIPKPAAASKHYDQPKMMSLPDSQTFSKDGALAEATKVNGNEMSAKNINDPAKWVKVDKY